MRERRPSRHRAAFVASQFEIAHHRFGVFAGAERIEFQPVRFGVQDARRVVGFVHEPAWVAVEPSVGLFQAAAAGFDEEVVDQRHAGDVDGGVDEVVAPFKVVDAGGRCLQKKMC